MEKILKNFVLETVHEATTDNCLAKYQELFDVDAAKRPGISRTFMRIFNKEGRLKYHVQGLKAKSLATYQTQDWMEQLCEDWCNMNQKAFRSTLQPLIFGTPVEANQADEQNLEENAAPQELPSIILRTQAEVRSLSSNLDAAAKALEIQWLDLPTKTRQYRQFKTIALARLRKVLVSQEQFTAHSVNVSHTVSFNSSMGQYISNFWRNNLKKVSGSNYIKQRKQKTTTKITETGPVQITKTVSVLQKQPGTFDATKRNLQSGRFKSD